MLKKQKGQQLSSLPHRQNMLKYGRIRISCLFENSGIFHNMPEANYMNKSGEARIRTSFLCAS